MSYRIDGGQLIWSSPMTQSERVQRLSLELDAFLFTGGLEHLKDKFWAELADWFTNGGVHYAR